MDVPFDIKIEILSYLPVEQILKIPYVNRLWAQASKSNRIWERLTYEEFGRGYSIVRQEDSWYQTYKYYYQMEKDRKRFGRAKYWEIDLTSDQFNRLYQKVLPIMMKRENLRYFNQGRMVETVQNYIFKVAEKEDDIFKLLTKWTLEIEPRIKRGDVVKIKSCVYEYSWPARIRKIDNGLEYIIESYMIFDGKMLRRFKGIMGKNTKSTEFGPLFWAPIQTILYKRISPRDLGLMLSSVNLEEITFYVTDF